MAYTQSDEISVLVHSYRRHESSAWFDNNLQKMCSVAAGISSATMTEESVEVFGIVKPAVFDARAFVLPESDVCNYFLWRQQDATRNSINSLAQSLYSHNELHGKNQSQLQEMCFAKGHNWNDTETRWKRGVCIVKKLNADPRPPATRVWSSWVADTEIPVFSQDRDYINRLLATEESPTLALPRSEGE